MLNLIGSEGVKNDKVLILSHEARILQLSHFRRHIGLHADVGGRIEPVPVAVEGPTVRADEKLLVVPLDVVYVGGIPEDRLPIDGGGGRAHALHVFEHFMLRCAVDVNLIRQWEIGDESASGANILQGVHQFDPIMLWLFEIKLVTRHGKDLEPLAPVFGL